MPAATAAAEPPLEPPEVFAGSQGFRVTPQARVRTKWTVPNSLEEVTPTGTAPALRMRPTWTLSSARGGFPLWSSEP